MASAQPVDAPSVDPALAARVVDDPREVIERVYCSMISIR
jgi:hypothetical protein